jgi:integrase
LGSKWHMLTKITKRTIDQLKPRQSIADSEVRGFRARCLPSGSITYEFRYRNADGQRQFVGLGLHGSITADQARALAKKRAGEVADNRDPAEERRIERAVSDNTVNVVLDDFVRRYVEGEKRLRSVHDIKSAFDRLVRPQIGDKPIADVRRRDIVDMIDHIADNHGLAMADRTLAYLRKAFNWYAARDEDFDSPIIKGMARTKPSERQRDRVLNEIEIRDLWNALDQLKAPAVPSCYPDMVRALLLSGQRRANVAKAHRDEIEGDIWIIPGEAKSEDGNRMKGGRDHLVPITTPLQGLFGNRKGFLFSSDGGKTPFSGFSKAKRALDRKINALRKTDGRKAMPHWTLHDLRRTARTILSRYATPDHAERVIGHIIGGVRGVYDLYEYADEKRAALEKLAAHVEAMVREKAP